MKRFWAKHTRLRRLFSLSGIVVALCLVVLLYLAYGYMPTEDRVDTPAYLTQIEAQHLDGYVNAGNFHLHYLHEGSGEPVLLLPGGGAWIYDLRNIVAALAPHYAVYAIDVPGDGYTTPLVANPDYNHIYTLDSIDQALLSFLNQLHIQRAAFIGNSWGGGYALSMAERYPDRVSKYISLDGTGLNLPDPWYYELAKWPVLGEVAMKLALPTSVDGMKQELGRYFIFNPSQITEDMAREFYIPLTFHCNLVSQWVLERNLHWSVTDQLIPQMKTPTLILWGRQDQVEDAASYTQRWHRLDPQARIVLINHAGHLVQDDQPEQVNQLIMHFLGGESI